jgi:hypothetical protein
VLKRHRRCLQIGKSVQGPLCGATLAASSRLEHRQLGADGLNRSRGNWWQDVK